MTVEELRNNYKKLRAENRVNKLKATQYEKLWRDVKKLFEEKQQENYDLKYELNRIYDNKPYKD